MLRTAKRSLSLLAVSLSLVLLLAGCTSGNQTQPTPTPGSSEVILIWWNLFEPEENVKPLIDSYRATHPNVKIQYIQKGVTDGVDGYKTQLDAVLNDSDLLNAPDIFSIHNSWGGTYEKHVNKAPADILAEADLADFYPAVKADFYRTNAVEALPIYMDTLALIYNKDKLIEKGYTVPADQWSDLQIQTGPNKLTKLNASNKIESAGFSAGVVANTEFNFELFNLLLMQNGVKMFDTSTRRATFNTGGEANKTAGALAFYKSFTSSSATMSWDKDQKKDIAAFLENDLAIFAAPSWRLIDIIDYNQRYSLQLKVGTAKMPQVSGTDQVYYATYWGQTVSKESSKSREAWEFIKYITAAEQLRLLDKTVKEEGRPIGILYPRISMAGEINDPLLKPYVESLPRAAVWNMHDGYEMKKAFDKFFNNGAADLLSLEGSTTSVLQSR